MPPGRRPRQPGPAVRRPDPSAYPTREDRGARRGRGREAATARRREDPRTASGGIAALLLSLLSCVAIVAIVVPPSVASASTVDDDERSASANDPSRRRRRRDRLDDGLFGQGSFGVFQVRWGREAGPHCVRAGPSTVRVRCHDEHVIAHLPDGDDDEEKSVVTCAFLSESSLECSADDDAARESLFPLFEKAFSCHRNDEGGAGLPVLASAEVGGGTFSCDGLPEGSADGTTDVL